MTAEPWVSVAGIALHLDLVKDSCHPWIDRQDLTVHQIGWRTTFKD